MSEHPDIKYLKGDDITPVIMKGLAETYKSQPSNPVDFLAKWLLNHCHSAVTEDRIKDEAKHAQAKKEEFANHIKNTESLSVNKAKEEKKKEDKVQEFIKKIHESDDLENHLQELSDFMVEHTNSTTCYIGKIAKPKKQIEDHSDDQAHINEEAAEEIEIIHASPAEFKFLIGKTIKPNEGVAHRLFSAAPVAEGEGEEPPANEGEGEEEPKTDEPKSIFIDQVVREKKIKFFRVPRLGSLLAIRLSYQSCLSEKAVENAIADKIECDKKREEQEAERKAREEDGEANKSKDDDEETKIFEEIKEKEFLFSELKYVVCIDTMGQDRSLTSEQIKFSIGIVKDYAQTWQNTEQNELRKDIHNKIEAAKKDKEHLELEERNIQMDEERYIEEMIQLRDDIETDEHRERESKVYKLEFSSSQLTGLTTEPEQEDDKETEVDKSKDLKATAAGAKNVKPKEEAKKKDAKDEKAAKDQKDKGKKPEAKPDPKTIVKPEKAPPVDGEEDNVPKRPTTPRYSESIARWRKEILELKKAKVIRFPKIFQSIFYILQYKREDICEVGTNKLSWKKAKEHINDDFFMRLFKYNPVGPKPNEFKPYQKINFIEKLVSDIDIESVINYSHTFGKLLSWVKLAIEVRRENVVSRILNKKRLKAERQAAQEQEAERLKDRTAFFEDEKQKWDELMDKKREDELAAKAERENERDEGEEDEYADYDENEEEEKKEEGEKDKEEKHSEKEGEGDEEKFDEAEIYERFDEEKPPVEIPPEVFDDIDNDIDITPENLEDNNE